MLKHRKINQICWAALVMTVLISVLFAAAASQGLIVSDNSSGYEKRLFDTSRVHTVDIVMEDWEGFLKTAMLEEYSPCTVVIDGEKYANVGIRAKGNTSLSQVAAYGNNRYSFKIEFDQYERQGNYYGLDKLNLNNMIHDNTYMKDYLSYQMISRAGAASPLASYAYITVNGEEWGLYLAVEAVEESFLQRNYGRDYGKLYKPDSMSMGGGRGFGRDFNIDDFYRQTGGENTEDASPARTTPPEGFQPPGGGMAPPGGFDPSSMFPGNGAMPEGFDPSVFADGGRDGQAPGGFSPMEGGFGGMTGQRDVRLQYIDDDPASYPNIFNQAKTKITSNDQTRLIASLKKLSAGEDIADVVDVDSVIRYLVAHDFVRNDDSYTGMMVHNYYLYEKNGALSIIPWDYNLAFGGFSMGGMGGNRAGATGEINSPIDSPVSGGTLASRPMVAWIFEDEAYTDLYHQYYAEFITSYFDSGCFEQMMDQTIALISPYVRKDPTAFCTYEEFETGVDTLREFCLLRAKSVSAQLSGDIPSTQAGQGADSTGFVDASHISISQMGTMGGGLGGFGGAPEGERNMPGGQAAFPSFGFREGSQSPDNAGQTAALSEGGSGDNQGPPAFPNEGGFAFPPDTERTPREGRNTPLSGEGGTSAGMPRPAPENQPDAAQTSVRIMLGACALLLLLGIVIVAKYRR